tara:strand:- start:1058 stop:1486 length:429 start_codon:yes stop_codon:yes gene_type:complete
LNKLGIRLGTGGAPFPSPRHLIWGLLRWFMKKILFILIGFFSITSFFYFSNYINEIKIKKTFIIAYDLLTFKKQQYQSLHSQIKQNLLLSKFGELKLDLIKLNERDFYKPLGYLEIINNEIIYLAANGELLSINNKFKKKKN